MHGIILTTYTKAGESVNSAATDIPYGGNGIGINFVCLLVAMETTDVRLVANSKTLSTTSTTATLFVGPPTLIIAFSGSNDSSVPAAAGE